MRGTSGGKGPAAGRAPVALVAALLAALPAPAPALGGAPAAGTTLVYGGDAQFPPYEFLDERGEPAGLNVDLIRAVGRHHGWKVRVELRPWPEVRAALQRGDVDVAAMYRSPQRAREVDFAIPHELVYHELYVRRGAAPLRVLDDLAGKHVLLEADTYSADALRDLGLQVELRLVASEPEALRALARGEGDAAIVTQSVGRPFQDRRALGDAIVATGPPVLLAEYAYVTRHGRRLLLEALNEGVAAVKASGEYDELYLRWLRPDRSAERVRGVAWALAAAVALVLLVVAWNAALRRRVAAQTEALRREFQARERAQAELAESERGRRQAQKLEAIGRLAGGVAHDFNNVLGVILSNAAFLREELARRGADTTDADEITSAGQRAARLTRQLLSFSRSTPVETRSLDLGRMVRELDGMLRRLGGETIQVELSTPQAPAVVEADPSQLEQVIINLAANARDAMPGGGRLRVSVALRTLPAGNAQALPPGSYVALSVSDTGVGMDEATRGRVFEPFFTTKRPGQGTGLGLATVFAHVQKLRGQVEVESAPGRGSTFTVLLPEGVARSAGPEAAPAPAAAPATSESILLVEDDEALRRAARLALERAGHRVLEAADGEEALEVAAGAAGLTLVVTDVVLPRRSGPQLVAALRARQPSLRVLFMSGYVQDGESPDISAPGTAFLVKPWTPLALVEAVGRLGEASRPTDRSGG